MLSWKNQVKILELKDLSEEDDKTRCAKLCKIHEAMMKAITNLSIKQNTGSQRNMSRYETRIRELFSNNVPKFGSGIEVTTFIQALQLNYNVVVKPNPSDELEAYFVTQALGYMAVEYAIPLTDFGTIATFEQLKQYLKTNHSSKMSVFQVLDTANKVEIRSRIRSK